MQRRFSLLSALAGGLIAALVVSALPAIAQDPDDQAVTEVAEDRASPGDPFLLGLVNLVNRQTVLRGDAGASNLMIRNTGGEPPLSLRTAGGTQPPLAVDSRGKVRRLNADLLDSRHANGLIRAAFGSTDSAAHNDGDAVTATITAPQRGVLIMGGSIDAKGAPGFIDGFGCMLTVNGVEVPGTSRGSVVAWFDIGHTANSEENCSTDGGLIVEKGTHTVALSIFFHDGAAFDAASVWVIWSPFGGDGMVPNPADSPIGEPNNDADERDLANDTP